MAEQTEPNTGGEQRVPGPAPAPMAPDEVRQQFMDSVRWAQIPLLATDGTGKASDKLQEVAVAVHEGRPITPAHVQDVKDAFKLLDSNEIVNASPRLQLLKDTFAVLTAPVEQRQAQQPAQAPTVARPVQQPVAEAPQVAAPAPAPAPAQAKPKATAPEAKPASVDDERDNFIRNALPVAAALRKSGKPEEAKQLEQVANAILQTKSMERTPAPVQQPAPDKEQSLKDMLANVYKAIDQDPALKNMPEAKNMRRASDALDKEGMLNITVRNGIVVSFVSNFTDNLSRTQQLATPAPEAKPVVTQAAAPQPAPAPVVAPAAGVPAPGVVAQPAPADGQLKVVTIQLTYNNPEEPGRGMPDVLGKRFQEAGASAEVVSTKPALVGGQSVSELKVSYRLDEPGINKVSALLDAAAIMRGSKLQEMPGDQQARKEAAQQQDQAQAQQAERQRQAETEQQRQAQQQAEGKQKVQQLVEQPAPAFQAYPAYTSFAPSTENGIIDSRKTIPHDAPQLNVAISDKGEFGINPKVDQKRLIGDGIASLEKFFDYALPTSGHKIAHVGLAEPGKMEKTERGWEVVTKGKLAITDTEGNVFRPQVSESPAIAPTPAATVAAQVPAPVVAPAPKEAPAAGHRFSMGDVPAELLAKMGVPVAELERTGQLQKLLEGKKTDLIQGFTTAGEPGEATKFAGKLLLTRDNQGVATLRVDLPKKELEIPQQLMGKEITPAMQQQLKTNGVVPLLDGFQDGKGQAFKAYLAVDQEMKRVVAVRPEGISVPKEVYGVKLSAEQQKSLLEGKPARIEGMTHPGAKQLVDALVQLDPLARKLVFRDTKPCPEQGQKITQVQEPTRRRGVRV